MGGKVVFKIPLFGMFKNEKSKTEYLKKNFIK